MKTRIHSTKIKSALYFIAALSVLVACDSGQGMMHGGGWSMYTGNWIWLQIMICLAVGFLLGYLVARRKK